MLALGWAGCGTTTDRPDDATPPRDGATGDATDQIDTGTRDASATDDATLDSGRPRDPYDFDGDGYADMIVGDPAHRARRGALWIARGSAAGPRAPEVLVEGEPLEMLGAWIARHYIDDRDGDGAFEIAIVGLGAFGGLDQAGRWLGSDGSTGTIARSTGYAPLAVIDSDGDDVLDVIASRSCGEGCGELAIVTAAGPRLLSLESVGADPQVLASDVDGDRRLDIVVASGDRVVALNAQASVLWTVTLPEPLAVGGWPLDLAGDIDGDGRSDLVAHGDGAYLLRPRADGVVVSPVPLGALVHSGALGRDVDCDGYVDIAYVGDRGDWRLVRGGPDGLTESGPYTEPQPGWVVPDLDGDGCRELAAVTTVAACPEGPGAYDWLLPCLGAIDVHPGSPAGGFPFAHLEPALTEGRVRGLLVAASDLWGHTDRFDSFHRRDDGALAWLDDLPRSAYVGDLTADGLPDLLEPSDWPSVGDSIFWRSHGDRFERVRSIGEDIAIIGDVDGDGTDDIARVDYGVHTLRSFLEVRAGGAAFPDEAQIARVELTPAPCCMTRADARPAGDLDADGLSDVIVNDDRSGSLVHVYLAKDLLAGIAEPAATLEGPALRAIGDVSYDGYADLGYLEEASSPTFTAAVAIYLGGPDGVATTAMTVDGLEGADHSVRATIASPIGVGGFHFGRTFQAERVTVSGVVPWGAPIALPRAPIHSVHWIGGEHGDAPTFLLIETAHEDGAMLFRFDDVGHDEGTLIVLPTSTARPTFGASVLSALR